MLWATCINEESQWYELFIMPEWHTIKSPNYDLFLKQMNNYNWRYQHGCHEMFTFVISEFKELTSDQWFVIKGD